MENLFPSARDARFRTAQRGLNDSTAFPPATGSPRNEQDEGTKSEIKLPRIPLSISPSLSQSLGLAPQLDYPKPLPLWLDAKHSKHIVKGDFMKLSVQPTTIDAGEWLAYQAMEHHRVLWSFVSVLLTDGLCSSETCPTMSAGKDCSYTWLDDDEKTFDITACQYMTRVQQWITTQFDNTHLFPVDPSGVTSAIYPGLSSVDKDPWRGARSGFPEGFEASCRSIFRQMFRVYAHIYWNHFIEPFYHLNLDKHLNSCFCYFLHAATALGMLGSDDVKPMQHIIDLWAVDGTLSPESKLYTFSDTKVGDYLVARSI